ncbi:MAG: UDP-N-acetylmuramate dehydrogenase [Pseudomonadota bacterium]
MAEADSLRDLAGLVKGKLLWREPLARHTTFGIGGAAELLIIPADAADLIRAMEFCQKRGLRWRVMGNGSNLLVSDAGVAGVVFKVKGTLGHVQIDGRRIVAGAGLLLARLIDQTTRLGLGGLEYLTGIPGTLGGALAMNAGAHGHGISECVREVTFWQAGSGVRSLAAGELHFAYRDSLLRREGLVALEAELELEPGDVASMRRTREEIMARRRATQPLGVRSAGSVFRNPPKKTFAGALLEAAGLKGTRIGGAEVSSRHANFIVNLGGATAADVRALMDLARARVKETAGEDLLPEITLWDD